MLRFAYMLAALRATLITAFAASLALAVDYTNVGSEAFCGKGGGCDTVKASEFSALLGMPTPTWGMLGFTLLFFLSLNLSEKKLRLRFFACSLLAAALALTLIAIQAFVLHAFCSLCILVDTFTVFAAIIAFRIFRDSRDAVVSQEGLIAPWAIVFGASALLVPLWARNAGPPPLPQAIAGIYQEGKLNIVSFTDFQCPYCRRMHPLVEELKHANGTAAFTRKMVPLNMHKGALPAAKAYLCVPEDKRDKAADWLYTADDTALTDAGVRELAHILGIDAGQFISCLEAPTTQAKVDADRKLYESVGGKGLPLTYVGQHAILGYDPEALRRAASEEKKKSMHLPKAGLPAVLVALYLGALFATVRKAKQAQPNQKVG